MYTCVKSTTIFIVASRDKRQVHITLNTLHSARVKPFLSMWEALLQLSPFAARLKSKW
jgi:hypothetical protein